MRVLPTYIKLYEMPLFLFCGAEGICVRVERGLAVAVNYSCVKHQLNIGRVRLWFCSFVSACCATISMYATRSTFLISK